MQEIFFHSQTHSEIHLKQPIPETDVCVTLQWWQSLRRDNFEPSSSDVWQAINAEVQSQQAPFASFVFAGVGEPTLRLPPWDAFAAIFD